MLAEVMCGMTSSSAAHRPRAERLAHVAVDVDFKDRSLTSAARAAIVTMPSKKVPRRRFSFSSCWLLSKFTVGTQDRREAERVDERGDRDRAAERAQLHRRLAERARHRRDERARVRIRRSRS